LTAYNLRKLTGLSSTGIKSLHNLTKSFKHFLGNSLILTADEENFFKKY